ncbi:hypothetical protein C1645_769234, partial [Glomus cerebriforme]
MMRDGDTIEEDQIEWVSGSSPKGSRKIVRHTNSLEIPLKQIHFNSSRSECITASEGSMALFLNDKTLEVSICLNHMKDEISFQIREVEEFKITRDNSVIFRLHPRFSRSYYYHPKGYSFKGTCIPRDSDPTGGKLSGISCINLKSSCSIGREYNLVDEWIKKMISRSRNTNKQVDARRSRNNNDFIYNPRTLNRDNRDNRDNRNRAPPIARVQNDPPRSYANSDNGLRQDILPVRYDNAIKKRELYITCICPTQKRAIIYPSDGIFNHFQFHIGQRFGWKWERMWYKNKTGGWAILNNDSVWTSVKKQVMSKPIPRIEVFM